jgi:hypothetical protein
LTTPPRRTSPTSKGTRRSRRPAPRSATFLERNRNRLLYAGAALVVALLAGMTFLNATQPAYACTDIFNPTPAPSVALPTVEPGTTNPPATPAPPGFVQPDMGHLHVGPGTRVRYANCPPASGKHYNQTGQGPIKAGVYGPSDPSLPEGWIHNLEHGAIVLLYKCPGPGCDDAGQAALKALYAKWPNSPVCKFPPGSFTPVIARFDDMPWPYAAVVWDVVLPMQSIDESELFAFYTGWGERFNPEKQPGCVTPTASPGATPTTAPTGSPAPTATPTAAPTAGATPAATSAPSPS